MPCVHTGHQNSSALKSVEMSSFCAAEVCCHQTKSPHSFEIVFSPSFFLGVMEENGGLVIGGTAGGVQGCRLKWGLRESASQGVVTTATATSRC